MLQRGAGLCRGLCLRVWSLPSVQRALCTAPDAAEQAIAQKLKDNLDTLHVKVVDSSGGCGAMYVIEVIAQEFKGKTVVQQHQMLAKILKDDIKQWHGFNFNTRAPNV